MACRPRERGQHGANLPPFDIFRVQILGRAGWDAEADEHALDARPALAAPPRVERLADGGAVQPSLGAFPVRGRMMPPPHEDVGGDLLGPCLVVDDPPDDPRQPPVVGLEQQVEAVAGDGRADGHRGRVQCVHDSRTRERVDLGHAGGRLYRVAMGRADRRPTFEERVMSRMPFVALLLVAGACSAPPAPAPPFPGGEIVDLSHAL